MGAWNEDNFGNDDASDWVYDLEKSKGLETLMSPIEDIIENSDYLESPECSEALAASEVVAASLTNDFSLIPEEAINWLNKKQGLFFGKKPSIQKAHALIAIQAVEKILNDSELKELWEETEDFANWQKIQNTLLAKLKGV